MGNTEVIDKIYALLKLSEYDFVYNVLYINYCRYFYRIQKMRYLTGLRTMKYAIQWITSLNTVRSICCFGYNLYALCL